MYYRSVWHEVVKVFQQKATSQEGYKLQMCVDLTSTKPIMQLFTSNAFRILWPSKWGGASYIRIKLN